MPSPAIGQRVWQSVAAISTPSLSTCSAFLARSGRSCPKQNNPGWPSGETRERRLRQPKVRFSIFRHHRTSPVEAVVDADKRFLVAKPEREGVGQGTGAAKPRVHQSGRIKIAAFGSEIQIVVFAEHRPARGKLPFETTADRVAGSRKTRRLACHRTGSNR